MKNKKNNKTFTKLSEIGEFELIKRLTKSVKLSNKSTVFGIGDDSSILDFGEENVLVSSDMLIEGVHFDLSYMPLKHLGYKAIISNLSDIYSMNSQCTEVLVNIGVSNRFNLESLEEVYLGINSACNNYGVDLVGGDTTSSNKGLIISVTAIGSKDPKSIKIFCISRAYHLETHLSVAAFVPSPWDLTVHATLFAMGSHAQSTKQPGEVTAAEAGYISVSLSVGQSARPPPCRMLYVRSHV